MSFQSILARKAANKSAGVSRTYPQHRTRAAKTPTTRTVLPVLAPCVHGGTDADIIERCPTCNGGARHVRECEIHGRCTHAPVNPSVMDCARCRADDLGYLPTNAHPNIIAADAYARSITSFPNGTFSGRGIVIVGGGIYWPSVYVTVRMLRHVGCTLPVQVWYLGEAERDDRYSALLAPFNVETVDALAHPAASSTRNLTGFPDPDNRNGPMHPPFQVKSFAVLHSPFLEVLSLDADNYPCADPTILFDDPRYERTGAIFWPDLPHTNLWTKWDDWGIKPYGPATGLEVGQYLVNKARVWEPLNLMRWYDDHGDWCYGWGAHHDHGDKGPPRVAFAKFKRDYTMFATSAVWKDIAFLQPGPGGAPLFVHRCTSKFVLDPSAFTSSPQKVPNKRANLPLEEEAFGYLDHLRAVIGGIHPNGFWTDAVGHCFDAPLAAELATFFAGKSVLDLGCGTGEYVRHLQSANITTRGVDGNPLTPELAPGCVVADLAKPVDLLPADWVLCLEVGEHLPPGAADTFFANVHRLNRSGVVLSWAVPNQGGRGHFNEQPNEWVRARMTRLGYRADPETERQLRAASSLPWFANTLMVFHRGERPIVSLLVIAHNEEHRLAACIASARAVVDEVVIVVQKSTDGTLALARTLADVVVEHPKYGYCELSRPDALKACSGDWILSLDADETLTEYGRDSLRKWIAGPSKMLGLRRLTTLGEEGRVVEDRPCWRLFRRESVSPNVIPHTEFTYLGADRERRRVVDRVVIEHSKTMAEQVDDNARYDHIGGNFPRTEPRPPILRPNTWDAAIWESVVTKNEYELPDDMSGLVVLDIGAHVGAFAEACLTRGAAFVLSVECEPSNFDTLQRNLAHWGARSLCLRVAAWRSDDGHDRDKLTFLGYAPGYAGERNTGGGACMAATETVTGGVLDVYPMAFDAIFDLAVTLGKKSGVDVVKFDCEGSEGPILHTSRRLASVRQTIMGEWHSHLDELFQANSPVVAVAYSPDAIRTVLEGAGFAVEMRPTAGTLGIFRAARQSLPTMPNGNGRKLLKSSAPGCPDAHAPAPGV